MLIKAKGYEVYLARGYEGRPYGILLGFTFQDQGESVCAACISCSSSFNCK